jgi:hypothetical protein
VGWLYGATHYGTVGQPSMSQAAVRAMAQTRHVYLEQTDRLGSSWPMRNAVAQDLEATARAKGKAAMASADRVRRGIIAAKKLEDDTGGVALVLARDPSYYEAWDLAHNYCGAFYEYGTERLALAFATGEDITVHSLETGASRQAALDAARGERCRRNQAGTPSQSPHGVVEENLETICRLILRDLARDQGEGRPASLTAAAACVVDSRHRTMAARIAAAVKAGKKPFVIVGGGHLLPGQTLIPLLEEQGLTVRRID